MDYVDYITASVVKALAETYGSYPNSIILTDVELTNIIQRQMQAGGGGYLLSLDEINVGIEQLSQLGYVRSISTPHARLRYTFDLRPIRGIYLGRADPSPLARAATISKELGWDWLKESLTNSQNGVPVNDPASGDPSWAPLAIDRPDEKLDEAIRALSEVEALVRADNGYAASEPAERDEVVSRLEAGISYLKNASLVTATSVEVYLVWPFQKLLSRFPVDTAVGTVATLAVSVVREWLKGIGVKVLSAIFNLPSS